MKRNDFYQGFVTFFMLRPLFLCAKEMKNILFTASFPEEKTGLPLFNKRACYRVCYMIFNLQHEGVFRFFNRPGGAGLCSFIRTSYLFPLYARCCCPFKKLSLRPFLPRCNREHNCLCEAISRNAATELKACAIQLQPYNKTGDRV